MPGRGTVNPGRFHSNQGRKMKLYNILLLLHGEMLNQVRLEMVSAAEIQLLRQIHLGNNEAVQDIVHVANTNRTDMAERRRLANKYSPDPFSL
jgi:hypothetical protein